MDICKKTVINLPEKKSFIIDKRQKNKRHLGQYQNFWQWKLNETPCKKKQRTNIQNQTTIEQILEAEERIKYMLD